MGSEIVERLNSFTTCGCCDDEWPSLRRDAVATITILEGQRLGVLAMMYQIAPSTVAKMCDEDLDKSGALLGDVRDLAARSALSTEKGE